jgi:hypothetical protein
MWMSLSRINGARCKPDGQADVFNNAAVIYVPCVLAWLPPPISGTEVIFTAQFIVLHHCLKLSTFSHYDVTWE